MVKETMRSMFGDLKSRISGFRHRNDESYYEDESYDDYEEDYEYDDVQESDSEHDDVDYRSERRYEDNSQRFAAEMDARYSKAVTTRPSRAYQSPRLVSMDDVRSNTAYDGERETTSSYRAEERRMNGLGGMSAVTPVGTPAASVGAVGGLDSLFGASAGDSWSTDTYGASSSAMTQRFTASRVVDIVRPLMYSEAEKIAIGLKAGNAVVLALKGTPDSLAARMTDFAFGVACALDATVERLCPKVYAITTQRELSEAERSMLKSQGVI